MGWIDDIHCIYVDSLVQLLIETGNGAAAESSKHVQRYLWPWDQLLNLIRIGLEIQRICDTQSQLANMDKY